MSTFSYYPGQDYLAKQFVNAESLPLTGDTTSPRGPSGFPNVLKSPLAWTRAEIDKSIGECILQLSEDDVTAIEAAARDFVGK